MCMFALLEYPTQWSNFEKLLIVTGQFPAS
ncbi:MAG: hypothetical protein JWM68_1995, partial [Verrucomicrobiales bacterium]|nr:hypothetical protein [Verrucomicrobiales bacterium]